MQKTAYHNEQQMLMEQSNKTLDQATYSAPTEALTTQHFQTATLDAAHEALVTILNRLFYLDQLLEVANQYGYPLDNILSQRDLHISTEALMEIAERVQSQRNNPVQELELQHGA